MRKSASFSVVNDAFHAQPLQTCAPHLLNEHVAVHVVAVFKMDKIFPFFRAGKIIHHDDIFHAAAGQLPDDCTAEESGSSGDNEHRISLNIFAQYV